LASKTTSEYREVIRVCKEVFQKKTSDYGTSWRILRLPSITDQIMIKAQRVRSIQEKGVQKVAEGIESEFIGMVNYCIIAMMQMNMGDDIGEELTLADVEPAYDKTVDETMGLLKNKNHDYDEAWRSMRISSMTDIVLMKIKRLKQIEDTEGVTLISEGVRANYQDIMNYAIFCLIMLNEKQ
jgi:hypothetical protein